MRIAFCWLLLLIMLPAAPCLAQGKGAPQPAPVLEAVAAVETIPEEIAAVGNVEAANTVEIKARINGELVQVHFEEGQDVKEGDVLFTLDKRPLEAALRESRAMLERNQALMRKAEEDNRRYEKLVNERIISREQFEEKMTNLAALQAQVKADEAAVESAQVELNYAVIRSPITGRTGQTLVDRGNMVKANADGAMVVIQQIEPIQVQFSVPEARLGDIQARFKGARLEVRAAPPGREGEPDIGVLTFIDNTVDRKTGAIALKATFENKSHSLWPGQFVNVQLVLGMRDRVVTVPSQAIMPSAKGEAVYVIKEDNTVEFRPVKTDEVLGVLDGRVVVASGLSGGERVVIDGHLRLAPGRPVEVRPAAQAQGGVAGPDALHGKASPSASPSTSSASPVGQTQPGSPQ